MSLADIVIVGLAAARGYQLLAHDSILDTPRQWVADNYPRVDDWLTCAWCAGFWIALAATVLWYAEPLHWIVLFAAITEVASLFGLAGVRLSTEPVLEVNVTSEEIIEEGFE